MAMAYPEKLFVNGPVFTGRGTARVQVAVRAGRIVAVGPDTAHVKSRTRTPANAPALTAGVTASGIR